MRSSDGVEEEEKKEKKKRLYALVKGTTGEAEGEARGDVSGEHHKRCLDLIYVYVAVADFRIWWIFTFTIECKKRRK